jgi:hypothetical protein
MKAAIIVSDTLQILLVPSPEGAQADMDQGVASHERRPRYKRMSQMPPHEPGTSQ